MKKYFFVLIATICLGCCVSEIQAKSPRKKTTKTSRTTSRTSSRPTGKGGKYESIVKDYQPSVPNPNFDSSEGEDMWNPRNITLECNVSIQWPTSLDGCEDITPLQNYIITKLLGADKSLNINDACDAYLRNNINTVEIGGPFGPGFGLSVEPKDFTDKWASYLITEYISLGSGTGAGIMIGEDAFIYDKKDGKILSGYQIADLSSPQLLKIVNSAIKAKRAGYSAADELPATVLPGKTSLYFLFPKYAISYGAEGCVRIAVPYSKIKQYLTPEFKAIMGF